jgi:hypothetical protein
MSGKDLFNKSLASHRATTTAEKGKRDVQEEGMGTGFKQKGNLFLWFRRQREISCPA